MKNIFFSVLFLLCFLYLFANIGEAAVPCNVVDMKAAACVGFATGKDPSPSAACCSGLQQLAQTVKTVDDKKAIFRCLKAGATSLGVQDRFLSKIPNACHIKVGFPVSTSTTVKRFTEWLGSYWSREIIDMLNGIKLVEGNVVCGLCQIRHFGPY